MQRSYTPVFLKLWAAEGLYSGREAFNRSREETLHFQFFFKIMLCLNLRGSTMQTQRNNGIFVSIVYVVWFLTMTSQTSATRGLPTTKC